MKAETIQYYEKPSFVNVKFIHVYLNGVPVEMILDTGASHVVVNNETLQRLGGITFLKKGRANTAGGFVDSYLFVLSSVKVGNSEARNVTASFSPANDKNLLGGSFLKNFKYLIDEKNKFITLFPSSSPTVLKDNSVPVERPVVNETPTNEKQSESSLYFKVKK